MKNLYILVVFLCNVLAALSQNENNHWVLNKTHLDFSNSTTIATIETLYPPPPLFDYLSPNAFATISDENGNLLFSFDGLSIRNKNFNPINNGEGIGIDSWSGPQGAIIIPHPGDEKKYYLIWDMYWAAGNIGGYGSIYFYALIDFNNNPLGELQVISDINLGELEYDIRARLKDENNNYIYDDNDYGRPLTFSKNASNTGYWVIIQSKNKIYTYKVDPSGLDPIPLVSTFSNIPNVSQMFRVVPDFTDLTKSKLFGITNGGKLYTLDFNKSTGKFSNYQTILTENKGITNFEVSPDFKKLYYTVNNSQFANQSDPLVGQIFVKDLSSLSTPPRLLYEFNNPSQASKLFWFIQKDKYDNILVGSWYGSQSRNKYLHKIDNPNSFSNSSIKLNYIYMNGEATYSLPQLCSRVKLNCYDNLVLSNIETHSNYIYKSENTITTNGNYVINNGSNIEFWAGDAIYLEPNTDIKVGSIFQTLLVPCSGPIPMSTNSFNIENYSNGSEILNEDLVIYPNPSTDIATFKLNNGLIKTITIYSMDGRLVLQKDIKQNLLELNTSSYKQGIYMVVVLNEKGETITKKLIKN